jgi:hypothetical protein
LSLARLAKLAAKVAVISFEISCQPFKNSRWKVAMREALIKFYAAPQDFS